MQTTKTLVIIQSNYIPWRGYFDMIQHADELLFLDNVQYTRQDWRNRNIIKTAQGPQWITIPVAGRFGQTIDETQIADQKWALKHTRTFETNYRKAACYKETAEWLFALYSEIANEKYLSRSNQHLITQICKRLGISTQMSRAEDVMSRAEMEACEPTSRLVELCRRTGSSCYLSGPAARDYLDVSAFEAVNISVKWMDYGGYKPYPQLGHSFEPRVSIVDLLFNCGNRAADFVGK